MIPLVAPAGLLFLATGSIWLGAVLGSKKPEPKDEMTDETLDLTWWHVMIMPVTSSIFLLLLFYFFAYVQLIMILFIVTGSGLSCIEVLRSSIATFTPSLNGNTSTILSVLFTIYMVIQWATNGSFIAHDILGCSVCISSIALIRFPSLKLAAVCLTLLLLYDIFWVFYSEYFFHKNVMVEVATKSAINPLQALGVRYSISFLMSLQPKLNLPIKLLMPTGFLPTSRVMMLGLGDIALPGFLISLALRCDIFHSSKSVLPVYAPECLLLQDDMKNSPRGLSNPSNPSYSSISSSSSTPFNSSYKTSNLFEYGLGGYIFGLLLAFYVGSVSGHAQPALIYLVPGVMIPIALRAWQQNMFLKVWNGPSKVTD